jgi:hypothetical protein
MKKLIVTLTMMFVWGMAVTAFAGPADAAIKRDAKYVYINASYHNQEIAQKALQQGNYLFVDGSNGENQTVLKQNVDTIVKFFSLYLKDKKEFYSLWVKDNPAVITPFVSGDVAVLHSPALVGWPAVKTFWDPIFDEFKGRFDWYIMEIIPGADPNTIVTRSKSAIDVQTGPTWGNKHVKYNGIYVQIFRFEDGKVKSFEEYYDTALLNSAYK